MEAGIEKIGFPIPAEAGFDEIIDVRAPVEFAEDHVTGAAEPPPTNRSRFADAHEPDAG